MKDETTERECRHTQAVAAYAPDAPIQCAKLGKAVPTESYGPTTDARVPTSGQMLGVLTERLTLGNIDDAMRYLPWAPDQSEAGEAVRDALTMAAKAILRHVPDGAFRSVALRNIIEARMNANAAISFRGRF